MELMKRARRRLGIVWRSGRPAARQLYFMWRKSLFAPAARPHPGFMRGVDFYSSAQLALVLTRAMDNFNVSHGYYPDILAPRQFPEKLFASKFLRPFKVPEAGNKLLTSSFIPEELTSCLRCAEVVWRSRDAELPSNDAIAAGVYYFKASHGSGMFRRVRFPVDPQFRDELQRMARKWLSMPFGLMEGEWWYSAFEKEIFLEKAISDEPNTSSYNAWTFGDRIAGYTVFKKIIDPQGGYHEESIWLDADFTPLPNQNPDRPVLLEDPVTDRTKALISKFAGLIGRQFSFARVDFLIDPDGHPYLGEVTFTPGNASSRVSARSAPYYDLWCQSEQLARKYG